MTKKLLVFIISAFLMASLCYADAESTEVPEIHLLVDVSASMKKTDPQNLRIPAIRIFNKLTSQKALMSITTFSNKVDEIIPLKMVNQDYQNNFDKKPQAIASNGKWTDFVKALNEVNKNWKSSKRYIVLISDGKLDVGSDDSDSKSLQQLLGNTIPALQKNKVQVFTIGLSEDADKNTLNSLAGQTNGVSQFVSASQDLDHVLYTIFMAIVKPEGTVISKDSELKRSFIIDKNISDLTLVFEINTGDKDLELKRPDGQLINISKESILINRYRFLKLPSPMAGKWELSGPPQTVERALVLTDLKLISNLVSGTWFSDEQIWVMGYLAEKNQPLDSDLIKNTTKMTIELQKETNDLLYDLPYQDKGKFSKSIQLNLSPGVYNLFWKATSPLMTREHQFLITIKENPFEQTLDANKKLTVLLTEPRLIAPGSVKIRFNETPNPIKSEYNPTNFTWQLDLTTLCKDDEKPLNINPVINAVTTEGRPVLFLMPPQTLSCIKPPKPLVSTLPGFTLKKAEPEVVKPSALPQMPSLSGKKAATAKPAADKTLSLPQTSLVLVCFMLLLLIIMTLSVFFATRMIYKSQINKIKGQL